MAAPVVALLQSAMNLALEDVNFACNGSSQSILLEEFLSRHF